MTNRVQFTCPLTACEWTYTEPERDAFEAAVARMWAVAETQSVLSRHLQAHDVVEYAREIAALRREVSAATARGDQWKSDALAAEEALREGRTDGRG